MSRSYKPSLMPRGTGVGIALAVAILLLGGCASSKAPYADSVEPAKDDAAQRWQRGGSDYQQGRPAKTQSPYETALQQDRTNPDSVFRLGTAAYRRGDFAGATTHFEQVLAQQPNHSRAAYNLAMVRLRGAYEGLQRYLQLEPKGKPAAAARKLLQSLDAFNGTQ